MIPSTTQVRAMNKPELCLIPAPKEELSQQRVVTVLFSNPFLPSSFLLKLERARSYSRKWAAATKESLTLTASRTFSLEHFPSPRESRES